MENAPHKVSNPVVAAIIREELQDGRGWDEIHTRFRNSVITQALTETNWNISAAARLLKIHRNNVQRWMKLYEIPGKQ